MSKQIKQSVRPTGVVKAICISDKRGTEKRAIGGGHLLVDFGIEGDAHVGHWYYQVSLLSYNKVRVFNEREANVIDGAFGKNLAVEGIDPRNLPVGAKLCAGAVLLEMTQIGEECHSHCTTYEHMGECITPKEGVLVRVIREGIIHPEDVMRVEPPAEERPFMAVITTLSNRGTRGGRKDGDGPAVKELLGAAGYEVVELLLLSGELARLKTQLIRLADSHQVDPVLTSGGTGFPLRDQILEATMVVVERGASGIAEFIHMKFMEAMDRAMLSRRVSVTRGKTLIVNLSGSPRAAKENFGLIVGSLDHGLKIPRGGASECARS